MKNMVYIWLATVAVFLPVQASAVVYEEAFTQDSYYYTGTPEGDRWHTFTDELGVGGVANEYSAIVLSGTLDATGLTCDDPGVANQLATALSGSPSSDVSFVCNGNTWTVGACGDDQALAVNMSPCSCDSPGYSVRPTLAPSNANWGGVNSATCGGPTQTIRLEFVEGVIAAPAEAKPVPTMSFYGLLLTMLGLMFVATRRFRVPAKRK